jgi:hypothetical protein
MRNTSGAFPTSLTLRPETAQIGPCQADSCNFFSQRVDEVRPFVTQLVNLVLRLTFNPVVSFATSSLRILAPEQDILLHAATEQEHGFIAKDRPMARLETWSILGSVDIRGHDPVEIAPADDEPKGDATLVHSFNVVGCPGDGISDARVDSHCAQKGAGILYVRVGGGCSQNQPQPI